MHGCVQDQDTWSQIDVELKMKTHYCNGKVRMLNSLRNLEFTGNGYRQFHGLRYRALSLRDYW